MMAAYKDSRADSTLEIMARRYNVMEREVYMLHSQGKMSTTNPGKFTSEDIEAFFTYLKTKTGRNGEPVLLKTIKKDLVDLDKLCKFEENSCVDVFRARCPALTKNDHRDCLPVFSPTDIGKIFERSKQIDSTDDSLMHSYAFLALYFGAGLRTVELQNAEAANLHLDGEDAYIHPVIVKGADSYGRPRCPHHTGAGPRAQEVRRMARQVPGGQSPRMQVPLLLLQQIQRLSSNTIRQQRRYAE